MASRQSLLGITMRGIIKLQNIIKVEDSEVLSLLLMRWYGYTNILKNRNVRIDEKCRILTLIFKDHGINTCILKGQGNSLYYPFPDLRMSGDIDIWVDGKRDNIINFVRSIGIKVHDIHLVHATAEFFEDVSVELHFTPSWMYNPFHAYRLNQFFLEQKSFQFQHYDSNVGYTHPNNYFNLVYNIVHINRHIFDEGIGLRQIVDYYYILLASSELEKQKAINELRVLGLEKFTAALMYVMHETLGVSKDQMLCIPNEKLGNKILVDILDGGNFGKYGRFANTTSNDQRIKRGIINMRRNLIFLFDFPEEVLWIPFFKLWHWFWRKVNRYL